jgi:hypothetical protein
MNEVETPPISLAERLGSIFISPSVAFADIARRPGFVFPLGVLVVASVAVTETMLAKIGIERIIRTSLEQSGRASNMSPEQMQDAVQRGASVFGVITHVLGVLGAPIFLLIVAGIGMLVLNAIFGEKAGFAAVLSSVCYAALPGGIVRTVMALPMIFLGDPEHFNAENPVPTNAAFFLNPHSLSKPLMVLAGSADILTLWFVVLLGIGLSEVSGRKVKARTVFLVYAGLWALVTLGRAGLAALT